MKKRHMVLIFAAVLLLIPACIGANPIEDKYVSLEVELPLWDKSQWTDKTEDAQEKKILKVTVKLKIPDESQPIDESELRALVSQEIGKVIRQEELALEFRSRFNYAGAVAQILMIQNPEDLRALIQKEFPWRWALGPLEFEKLLAKALEFSPELTGQMIEVVANANQYEIIRFQFIPTMEKLIDEQNKRLGWLPAGDVDEAKQLLKEFTAYPPSLGSLGSEAAFLEREIGSFMARRNIPAAQAQNAFVFLVSKEWLEAKKDILMREWANHQDPLELPKLIEDFFVSFSQQLAATPPELLEEAGKYRLEFISYLEANGKTFLTIGSGNITSQLAQFNAEMAAFWETSRHLDSYRALEALIYKKWLEEKMAAWNDFFRPNVHSFFIGVFDYSDPQNIWLWKTACRAVLTQVPEGRTPGEYYEEYFIKKLKEEGFTVFSQKMENRTIGAFPIKSISFALE